VSPLSQTKHVKEKEKEKEKEKAKLRKQQIAEKLRGLDA